MKTILVIEDEPYMMNLLKIHLRNDYQIIEAKDGAIALDYIKRESYDLIILDVMLPYINGWTLCEKIREKGDVPILMLTARTELSDKVRGLDLGADDYLVKPFEFEELKARIKALLRRAEKHERKESDNMTQILLKDGLFNLDKQNRKLYIKQEYVDLTAKEFDLISLLASSPSRVFTRDVLLDQIWEEYEFRDLRIVDTHIKNIRTKLKKITKDIRFIQTVWGVGYTLDIKEDM